jgi:hypothetical protein
MAKRRPKPDADPDNDQDGGGGDELPESQAAALEQQISDEREGRSIAAIEAVLESVERVEGQFAVKRIDPLSGKQLHLERMPIAVLRDYGSDPSEFLKARYGGGQYNLIFYVPEQGGGWRQYTMRRFEVDKSIPPGEFFRAQREAGDQPERGADETLLGKLMDKIKTEGGGNSDVLLALMQMQAQASRDMIQVLMKSSADTLTAITSMVAALKGGGGQAGFNMLEALAVFDKLKGRDNQPDAIRLLELAHKWFSDHHKDEEDEPTWLKAIGGLLPALMGGGLQRPPPAPELAMPAGGRPGPILDTNGAPGQPQQPPPGRPMKPPLREMLKQLYPVIVQRIQEGTTPEDVFDWLNNPVTAFSDAEYNELVELFRLPTWETELFGDAKLIEPHRAWFQEIRQLFLAEDGPQDGPQNQAAAGGDGGAK